MTTTTIKKALVRGTDVSEDRVAPYLPSNYKTAGVEDGAVVVIGFDSCGWTLDDYVLPRLGSGLYFGTEVPLDSEDCVVFACSRDGATMVDVSCWDCECRTCVRMQAEATEMAEA